MRRILYKKYFLRDSDFGGIKKEFAPKDKLCTYYYFVECYYFMPCSFFR